MNAQSTNLAPQISQIKIHKYQQEILKKLALTHALNFNKLIIPGLESEHMNYHLQKLLELGLVQKESRAYRLSDAGKDYMNLLDDNLEIVEKQPKTSVNVRTLRRNPETGEIENLVCRRLRQPYYGKVGPITGKVVFGETLEQAAARELFEETGLHAESFALEKIYHKIRRQPDGVVVQDVIFYVMKALDTSGTLIERTHLQENFWLAKKDIPNTNVYDDFRFEEEFDVTPLRFDEKVGIAEGY